jgi:hypothetical protein
MPHEDSGWQRRAILANPGAPITSVIGAGARGPAGLSPSRAILANPGDPITDVIGVGARSLIEAVYNEAVRRGANGQLAHDIAVNVADRGTYDAFMAGRDRGVQYGVLDAPSSLGTSLSPGFEISEHPGVGPSGVGTRTWAGTTGGPSPVAPGFGMDDITDPRGMGYPRETWATGGPTVDADIERALALIDSRSVARTLAPSLGGVEGRRPDWGYLQTDPGAGARTAPAPTPPAPPPPVRQGPVDGRPPTGPGPTQSRVDARPPSETYGAGTRRDVVQRLFEQAQTAAIKRGANEDQVQDILAELARRGGGGWVRGEGGETGRPLWTSDVHGNPVADESGKGVFDQGPIDQFIAGLGMDLIYSLRAGEEGGPPIPGATPAPAVDPPRFSAGTAEFQAAAEGVERLGLAGNQRDALARMTGYEWESLRRALERGQGAFNLAIDTTTMDSVQRGGGGGGGGGPYREGYGMQGPVAPAPGSVESQIAELMRRYAEQDEQRRIDDLNRLALEQQRWEQTFAFDQSQWDQQYELEQLVYDLQAAEAERRTIESMSTPFASLMGQFQMRAPDEPVTLTPGVGAVLRGAGIPVSGEIPGEPVTVTANQITAGGGQFLRDLMTNMGAREHQAVITDPMEAAQVQTLAEVGGMGRLAYMQGLRNRQISERPVGPTRFV